MLNLHSDILLLIFSHLDVKSLALSEQSCKYFRSIISDKLADNLIYSNLLMHFLHKYKLLPKNIKLELNSDDNCKLLMKEFIIGLFKSIEFDLEAYRTFLGKGGVVDISLFSPCELVKKLLKCYKTSNWGSDIVIALHKFVLMKHVCNLCGSQYINHDDSQVVLLFSKSEVVYSLDEKNTYKLKDFRVSNRMSIGKAFIHMLDNFKEITSHRKSPKHVSLSFNNQSVISYCETLQKSEPTEGWYDIFDECSSPPYKMERASQQVQEMTEYLYGHENCEHYCWNNCIQFGENCSWSSYWLNGFEWWGYHAMTSYNDSIIHNFLTDLFIVATASTTD